MVLDTKTPRANWPLLRITKVLPNQHRTIHSVFVRAGNSELHRQAVKIYLLTEGENASRTHTGDGYVPEQNSGNSVEVFQNDLRSGGMAWEKYK